MNKAILLFCAVVFFATSLKAEDSPSVKSGFFDEPSDNTGYEIVLPTPKPTPTPEKVESVKENPSSIIDRVKSIVGDKKVVPIPKPTSAIEAETKKEVAKTSIKDFFSESQKFNKVDQTVMSLIVGVSPRRSFLKHLEAFYRLQKNPKVKLGQLMIVMGTKAQLDDVQSGWQKLDDLYNFPYFKVVYAGGVPKHYPIVSSPAWIAHVGDTDHVFEIGSVSPSSLFDREGNLLIPSEEANE